MSLTRLRWWHLPEVMALEGELFGPEAWSEGLFWSELAQRDTRHYVVDLAGVGSSAERVIGYAGLCVYADQSWIQTIGVEPACQGRGRGRALLRELLGEATARGSASVLLEVRADDPVAQGLYRAHGFADVGLRRGYYQPSGADALVMRCDDLTSWEAQGG